MSKNVVFFADGTGNDRAHGVKTNVAKLCDLAINMLVHRGGKTWQELEGAALDQELAKPGVEQITHYDAGIGTGMTGRVKAWLSSATGSGISQNIQDGYDFLVRFYEPGDRIFLFGFSRGAYTVRSLGGLVGLCGIPKRLQPAGADLRHDEARRREIVEEAYKIYRTGAVKENATAAEKAAGKEERLKAGKAFRKEKAYPEHKDPSARAPYFIGVWDTVRSLGIPAGGKNLEIELWPHRFHDHELNQYVSYAFHAVAIDDRREAFHPTLWNEPTKAQLTAAEIGDPPSQVFEQVWFPGVHCDVGGGYEECGLSDATLEWMIDNSQRPEHPLLLVDNPKAGLKPLVNAKTHDSRDALWKKLLYREEVRAVRRGRQEPMQTRIIPDANPHPDLHYSWVSVIETLYDGYNPVHMRDHPDYEAAVKQLGAKLRPLPGPWTCVRGRPNGE
jgi:uncharacterized protein (DUF2235 family)